MDCTRNLEKELGELFDIRNARIRRDRKLDEEAIAAQKDIKLLVKMFSEEIPSISITVAPNETLEWDSRSKKLVYHHDELTQFIEGVRRETLVRLRPFLHQLVKKAKSLYIEPALI